MKRNTGIPDEVMARMTGKPWTGHTQVRQTFYVPNTEEGRAWIAQLRKYLNRQTYTLSVRGRGKKRRQKGGNGHYIPLDKADYLGVYIFRKPDPDERYGSIFYVRGVLANKISNPHFPLEELSELIARTLQKVFGIAKEPDGRMPLPK